MISESQRRTWFFEYSDITSRTGNSQLLNDISLRKLPFVAFRWVSHPWVQKFGENITFELWVWSGESAISVSVVFYVPTNETANKGNKEKIFWLNNLIENAKKKKNKVLPCQIVNAGHGLHCLTCSRYGQLRSAAVQKLLHQWTLR